MISWVLQFIERHPGWGLAYLSVLSIFVLSFLHIIFGNSADKRKG